MLVLNQEGQTMNQVLTVKGMTCGHCEKAVIRALLALDPQARVTVDRSQDRVEVQSRLDRALLIKAIVDEGYTVAT
jgi:copper chaperone